MSHPMYYREKKVPTEVIPPRAESPGCQNPVLQAAAHEDEPPQRKPLDVYTFYIGLRYHSLARVFLRCMLFSVHKVCTARLQAVLRLTSHASNNHLKRHLLSRKLSVVLQIQSGKFI